MLKRLMMGIALLVSLSVVKADKVWLSDGSILVGQLQMLVNGQATIKTISAGDLLIDQSQIVNIETSVPLNGVLLNNERVNGKLQASSDGMMMEGVGAPIAVQNVKALWRPDMADPTMPLPPKGRVWAGEVYVDMSGKTGNTEKFNGGAGVKTTVTGPEDRLLLYLNGSYSRENSVTSEKEYCIGLDYEHSIANTLNSWFVRAEAEKDDFSGLDLRTQVVAGYGYFFFKEETTQLRFRIGLSYLRKEYENGNSDNSYGLDLNLHYERKIDEWGTLVSDLTYTPGLNNTDDYRIYHESALDIPLLMSKPLSLRLGISNEYNNLVAPGAERMDTTYFAKLVYKWK